MQFIGEYQIDPEICDSIVKLHRVANKQGLVTRGKLGVDADYKVDINKKDSYDLGLMMVPDDLAIKYRIPDYYQSLKDCVDQYIAQHEILKNLAPVRAR